MIKDYLERQKLYTEIDVLQKQVTLLTHDLTYHRDLLTKSRKQLVSISIMVEAITEIPDSESEDMSWERLYHAVMAKVSTSGT